MQKLLTNITLTLLTLFSLQTMALEKEPFTQECFEALQAAGEVVLIDVFATWWPTCKKQQEVLARCRTDNPDADFHILVVDFDKNDVEPKGIVPTL